MEQSNTAETPAGVILLRLLNVRGYIACEPSSPREGRKQFQTPSHTPLTHRLTGFLLALAKQPGKHGEPP